MTPVWLTDEVDEAGTNKADVPKVVVRTKVRDSS